MQRVRRELDMMACEGAGADCETVKELGQPDVLITSPRELSKPLQLSTSCPTISEKRSGSREQQ